MLAQARKSLYLILAEDEPATGTPTDTPTDTATDTATDTGPQDTPAAGE